MTSYWLLYKIFYSVDQQTQISGRRPLTAAEPVGATEYPALFDLAIRREHEPDVVLVALLGDHADEELSVLDCCSAQHNIKHTCFVSRQMVQTTCTLAQPCASGTPAAQRHTSRVHTLGDDMWLGKMNIKCKRFWWTTLRTWQLLRLQRIMVWGDSHVNNMSWLTGVRSFWRRLCCPDLF